MSSLATPEHTMKANGGGGLEAFLISEIDGGKW